MNILSQQNYLRVLILHPALAPYRLDFFNTLAARFQLSIIFLHDNALEQKFDQRKLTGALNVEHHYLTKGFTLLRRTVHFGIENQIKQFKPNVVITSEFSPTTLIIALKRRKYSSLFNHVVWTDDNPTVIAKEHILRSIFKLLILPRIDGLVVLSDETAKYYIYHYKVRVPIGVSPILHDEFIFREYLKQAIRVAKTIAISQKLEGKHVILFVGRLCREKRIDRIIKAFSKIHKLIPNVMLAIVGDGSERNALKNLSISMGVENKTIFTGRLEGLQLYAWYLLGGLFVLTSEFEPFGAVVNEALISGMPCICSNRAGAKTLIRNGDNGTVLDSSDIQALQSTIIEWLKKIEPISVTKLNQLRSSRMLISFRKSVDSFVLFLEKISKIKNQYNFSKLD